MTLAELAIGDIGVVQKITATGILKQRLLDLGLIPGTKVRACYKNPAGNPIAYNIRGTIIALREESAQMITIFPEVV